MISIISSSDILKKKSFEERTLLLLKFREKYIEKS